jgi:hypothetical protein
MGMVGLGWVFLAGSLTRKLWLYISIGFGRGVEAKGKRKKLALWCRIYQHLRIRNYSLLLCCLILCCSSSL